MNYDTFNLIFIYLHVTLMVCFKANFLLRIIKYYLISSSSVVTLLDQHEKPRATLTLSFPTLLWHDTKRTLANQRKTPKQTYTHALKINHQWPVYPPPPALAHTQRDSGRETDMARQTDIERERETHTHTHTHTHTQHTHTHMREWARQTDRQTETETETGRQTK